MLVLELDKQGAILRQNKNFEREFNYSNNKIINKNILDFIPENARNNADFHAFQKALSKVEHFAGAIQVSHPNGQRDWLRCILHPIKNEQGQLEYLTLHCTVLTQIIESSRENEDLIKALHRSTAVIEFDTQGIVLRVQDKTWWASIMVCFVTNKKRVVKSTKPFGNVCVMASLLRVGSNVLISTAM